MIGIVIVAHGQLAEAFRATLEHIVGPQEQLAAIAIDADDDQNTCRQRITAALTGCDTGDGAVILTDMFGGTPSNLAISMLKSDRVEVIAGVNLPLLVKLASARETSGLNQSIAEARRAGRKYICIASELLGGSGGNSHDSSSTAAV